MAAHYPYYWDSVVGDTSHVKIDSCPGRLNQVSLFIKREGVFYGQCSEICGVNHGFMPIVVRAISAPRYIRWAIRQISALD